MRRDSWSNILQMTYQDCLDLHKDNLSTHQSVAVCSKKQNSHNSAASSWPCFLHAWAGDNMTQEMAQTKINLITRWKSWNWVFILKNQQSSHYLTCFFTKYCTPPISLTFHPVLISSVLISLRENSCVIPSVECLIKYVKKPFLSLLQHILSSEVGNLRSLLL